MAKRDAVFPARPHALYEAHRYSPAIRANGFLFVSGQVGAREDGTPEPDLAAQARLAFKNLNEILAAAGCAFEDVVDVTLLMTDPEKTFETVLPVLGEFWGEPPYPALTGVGVTWLAGFSFELKVVVKLPG
ncbi:MAG: RidA family protein [Amphiplicatus sp.]